MEWFTSWFDTPYYHQLYSNRNFEEAEKFMSTLIKFLNPKKDAKFLDLACGKGRHSIFLRKKGFCVTGVDLSEQSIKHAKKFETDRLKFYTHDMRENINEKFDVILNLFTSFGYFDDDRDDIKVLETIKNSMHDNSLAVIDFMNVKKTISLLTKKEIITRGNINFDINRRVENNMIIKNISFSDKKIDYNFTEKVKAIDLKKFKQYFEISGLKLKAVFGNYNLETFDKETSDRLIMLISL